MIWKAVGTFPRLLSQTLGWLQKPQGTSATKHPPGHLRLSLGEEGEGRAQGSPHFHRPSPPLFGNVPCSLLACCLREDTEWAASPAVLRKQP